MNLDTTLTDEQMVEVMQQIEEFCQLYFGRQRLTVEELVRSTLVLCEPGEYQFAALSTKPITIHIKNGGGGWSISVLVMKNEGVDPVDWALTKELHQRFAALSIGHQLGTL